MIYLALLQIVWMLKRIVIWHLILITFPFFLISNYC